MRLGSVAVSKAASRKVPEIQQIYQVAFCIGSEFGVLLPFSRLHETEADKIGMVLMAKAGYDPHEFIYFFERMQAQTKKQGPGFFSTHPTNEKRIQSQKRFLKEALKYYHN
jgi:predicted Zn-dependent protease